MGDLAYTLHHSVDVLSDQQMVWGLACTRFEIRGLGSPAACGSAGIEAAASSLRSDKGNVRNPYFPASRDGFHIAAARYSLTAG